MTRSEALVSGAGSGLAHRTLPGPEGFSTLQVQGGGSCEPSMQAAARAGNPKVYLQECSVGSWQPPEARYDIRAHAQQGMELGREIAVWVDGVQRVARIGPRGIEVVDSGVNPFANSGRHPFVQADPVSPPPPPPAYRISPKTPLRFSPTTPNGTKVPKGPPPSDSMDWPNWANTAGGTDTLMGPGVPPPPVPPHLCESHGPGANSLPDKPEEPSRSVTDLPELQAYTPQDGSVLAGDWITQLSPVIGTMSATSGVWWADVLREAYRLYADWLAADPVQRLSIKAGASGSLSPSPRHVLIEQRLTVLLMRAVPAEIRAELVAVRAMSSLAVVVAVLCRYQPGGPNERANVLAFLVAPERPGSIDSGIATCRRWLRQLQQAKELGLMLPDATLLIKGADSLLGPVLTKSQQASFRLNSFRNERKLDYAPAFDSIVAFGQLILAEYELLQHSEPTEPKKPRVNRIQDGEEDPPPKGGKGKQNHGKQGGAEPGGGKGTKGNGSGKESARVPCKYWCITDMGCVKASKCPDIHSKDLLKGTTRCWVCSSSQHQKQDCPRTAKESPEEAAPKAKGGKNRQEPKVKVAKGEDPPPTLAPSAQQLLQDTATLLKNLKINKIGEGRASSRALLDSGATACMRTARPEELAGLPERTVQLAQGEIRLRVNEGGTLLTPDSVDPIVSLHKLCQLGYRVDWTREGGCQVRCPGRPALRVYTNNGCPEVDREAGLDLIREIEVSQMRNAQALRSLKDQAGGEVSLREALKALPVDPTVALKWLARKFPSLPPDVLARIPVAASYDPSRVAWNRRQRRSWLRSKAAALHLFSGPQKKFWELPRPHAHCVCVDVQENLLDDHTYAFLESMAMSGHLCAVLGGPPCKTFSLSRYLPPELPRPLRGRTPSTQWGFDYLTPSEREAIYTDGVLMFRMVWLYLIAEAMAEERQLPKPFFGMEHPKDPDSWASPEDLGFGSPPDGFASCWALDAIKDFASQHELHFWHLDQGPLGHERRKPTTILSSVPPPPDVQVSGPGHGVKGTDVPSAGSWPSTAWAAWAPGLKAILKREVLSAVDAWSSEKCSALREQENFLRHVVQGHVDFRRDCAACLAGAARGARHNRRSVHDAWVLHLDLLGPFMEGADEHGRVKYALTGILTVPDLSRVSDSVKESEDIAAGSPADLHPNVEPPGVPVEARSNLPLSFLGPSPCQLPGPPEDCTLEEYEPSEAADVGDVMELQRDSESMPETEAEASAVARANKRWRDAAQALQLQACPVIEREFNNGVLHRVCRQRDLYQTFTQGDDPQQNGRVESYHARLKGRTRTFLQAASAVPQDWPYAMRTAQASMWTHAMTRFGRSVCPPLPFGTKVRVRTRSWERYGNVWSDRVQDAVVLAPSIETCKGHVVRTAGGILMHTTALFRGAVQLPPQPVVDPNVVLHASTRAAPVPVSASPPTEVAVAFPTFSEPSHRVTGKQPPTVARVVPSRVPNTPDDVALSAVAAALLSSRPVPFRTAAALIVSAPVLKDLAQRLPARLGAGESSKYLLFGWYKHGGLTGVSGLTDRLPGVVQLLNALLEQVHPDGSWTTLGLFFSAAAQPHVDRRNVKNSCNHVLPLALPPTEQYMWVQRPVQGQLDPLNWLGPDGQVHAGFRLPLVVGQPASVDPHSLHALPAQLPHEAHHEHVLLVGFSVPWLHRATAQQLHQLQSHGFRLGLSRGGVDPDKGSLGSLGKEQKFLEEKVFLARDGSANVGLLETCIVEEGQRQLGANLDGQEPESCDIQQDVQEDIAAEGSVTGRGTYARRLEARVFEPANWDRVKQYLITLGLEHLIESIDALGVDDLEDFEFLYREDLMEAGATKEEAEAILNCTGAAKEGRSDPPPMARSGYHRPSRPATQAFQGPAVAARIVHANDRATRVLGAVPGATGSGAVPGATGSGAAPGATGSGAVPGATGSSVAPGATGSGAVPGAGATGLGAAPGATGSSVCQVPQV